MKNKNGVRLLVLLGIGLAVLGIWYAKNKEDTSQPVAEQTEVTELATEPVTETTEAAEVSETEAPAVTETAEEEATDAADDTVSEAAAALSLQSTEFDFEALAAYELPMMLDFGADDCVPCQQMKPDLEKIYEDTRGRVLVQYYDVWEDPSLTGGYPVQVVPTQFFFMPDGSPYKPSDAMEAAGLYFTGFSDRETGEHGLTAHMGILTEDEMRLIFEDMGVTLP